MEFELPEFNDQFNDQDFKSALSRALRTVLVLTVIGIPVAWVAAGWRSAALFLVGAAISALSVFEWQRLMGAVLERLSRGVKPRPLAPVLIWFFIRLLLAGVLLYVSLRSLEGSVYALIAGIALALIALMIESFRLLKVWTL
jgi:hypothetical protein